MKKEDIFCTESQARKLKSLGVAQESIYKSGSGNTIYTASELLKMLPLRIGEGNCEEWRWERDGKIHFAIAYKFWKDHRRSEINDHIVFSNSEAKARASYLIYALENKLISVESVNLNYLDNEQSEYSKEDILPY